MIHDDKPLEVNENDISRFINDNTLNDIEFQICYVRDDMHQLFDTNIENEKKLRDSIESLQERIIYLENKGIWQWILKKIRSK